MSKIQEALRKMQSSRRKPKSSQTVSRKHGASVAKISVRENALADDELENAHGVVIEINQEALRNAGLIAPDYHEKMLADQYREIKRPLIANTFGRRVARVDDGNLIMVTSALAGEGKTFTSLNLAISISQEEDLTVLLVDADVAKPHVSNVFGVSDLPGLLDVAAGDADDVESLIVPTDMEGLSILPAGAPRSNATELLSGSRMENLVQQLATRNPQRLIIFDTPPLLETTESKVLTSLMGQVVLVVRAEHTSQGAVAEALHVLGADKAVNLVLNQSRSAENKGQYHYSYGYGYSAPD